MVLHDYFPIVPLFHRLCINAVNSHSCNGIDCRGQIHPENWKCVVIECADICLYINSEVPQCSLFNLFTGQVVFCSTLIFIVHPSRCSGCNRKSLEYCAEKFVSEASWHFHMPCLYNTRSLICWIHFFVPNPKLHVMQLKIYLTI